jgi:hypothetical protein
MIPFKGPGLNTHGQRLNLDALHAIGINWVRGDLPPNQTEDQVRAFVKHYFGFPILWTIPQTVEDPITLTKNLIRWGITDVEPANEPEQGIFNPEGKVWSPSDAGKWFSAVQKAAKGKLRLYGPSMGRWDPAYIKAFLRGNTPTGISFHGYYSTPQDLEAIMYECKGRFGLPGICSEVGFPSHLGTMPYALGGNSAARFLELKRVMGDLPFCWYDGPNSNSDPTVGFFDSADGGATWTVPTQTYRDIQRGLLASVNE